MIKFGDLNQEKNDVRAWRLSLVMLGLLFLAILLLHFETLVSLSQWWGSTTKYGHALIILPVIVYLIYDRRKEFTHLTPTPQPILLLPFAGLAVLLSVFEMISVQIASETILIAMFALTVWLVLGNKITGVIAIPLLLLFMVVPAWELFSPILTEVTADVAHFSLNILGVPVFREGGFLTIPEGVFEVEEGCGGFRYFIAGLSLALVYAYMFYETLKHRVIVVVTAVIISIVINWLRVMIVIWAGHVTDMQHHFVRAHLNLGWWIFIGAFLCFFYIGNRFSVNTTNGIDGQKASESQRAVKLNISSYYLVGICALMIVCVIPVVNMLPRDSATPGQYKTEQLSGLYGSLNGWEGPFPYHGEWSPSFVGADNEMVRVYKNGEFSLAVYVAYYFKQDQGKELINLHNTLLNKNWHPYETMTQSIVDKQENELELRGIKASALSGNKMIWSWYYVSGGETIYPWVAKLLEILKIVNGNDISAVIAVLPIGEFENKNEKLLTRQFFSVFHPQIIEVFGGYE